MPRQREVRPIEPARHARVKIEIGGDSTTMKEEIPMPSVVRTWTIMLLSAVWLSSMGLAAAGEPTDLIRQTTDQVIKILDDPQLQGPEKQAQRQERLRKIADAAFDWPDMARRALATHWRERTPQQQQEFTALFKDLVQRTYLNRLDAAAGERQDIVYTGEQTQGSQSVVKTKVISKRQTQVPIDYRLHKADGGWKIYDVLIEGVSLVNNYRSQFNDILSRSSYDQLIERMKSRGEEAFAEPGRKTK
jgi:phospholipid transport system substrate-binding protein